MLLLCMEEIMESDSLGSRVKELRKQKNLTQIELGKLSGIHYTNIGRIENKGAIPQADVLYLIAKSLNTSVSWLLTGKSETMESETNQEWSELSVHDQNDRLQTQIIQALPLLTRKDKEELVSFINYLLYLKQK